MKKSGLKTRGFTVIETSLVIAIGGLILMMVFVALPALQRSQRDTSRRESLSKLITEIKNYQISNRGSLPTAPTNASGELVEWSSSAGDNNSWGGFYRLYLGSNFMDPDGEQYKLKVIKCNPAGRTQTTTGTNNSSLGGASGKDASGKDNSGKDSSGKDSSGKDSQNDTGDNKVLDNECTTTKPNGDANVSEQNFPNDHTISVVLGASCSGTKAIETSNPRNVAVLYKLEGAGEYCTDTD